MPGNVGLPEIIIVLVLVLIIFGPKRLPELGRSLGKGIREFRGSVTGEEDDRPKDEPASLDKGESTKPTTEATVTAEPVATESEQKASEN